MPISTQEVELEVAAPRLWAALKDSNVLFPKIAPQLYASIVDVEGQPGEIGSVRKLNFGPVAPEGAYVKEKLLALDHANLSLTLEEIEGGHLASGFKKWSSSVKLVPIDGKTKVESSFDYEGGDETSLERSKEGFAKVFKGLAAYVTSSGAYA